eukprot:g3527.t1
MVANKEDQTTKTRKCLMLRACPSPASRCFMPRVGSSFESFFHKSLCPAMLSPRRTYSVGPMMTLIDPFRIKSVEHLHFATREEREEALKRESFNLFGLKSKEVLVDMLTDSGTGAMSAQQWAGMLIGDETYAGSTSFDKMEAAVKDITGLKYMIPTHQGRAAERILFSVVVKEGDKIPSNNHFDTTRANIEYCGAQALDYVVEEGKKPGLSLPFKGNMDVNKLEALLRSEREKVPLVMITLTNNSGGGQPVSMANIKAVHTICKRYEVPFFFDACRFAENSWFIKVREEGYSDKTPLEIAKEMFTYADGATMSCKKDGMANIGGFMAMNNDEWATQCKDLLILGEGFPTYGGMAGYDMEAIALGLYEALDARYLQYRVRTVEYLAEKMRALKIPIVEPPGGHALFVDAAALLPHIPPKHYPAQALGVALYRQGGVRTVEVGSVMFGKLTKDENGNVHETPAAMELMRLAFPRRVYTQSHIDHVAEAFEVVVKRKFQVRGLEIAWGRGVRNTRINLSVSFCGRKRSCDGDMPQSISNQFKSFTVNCRTLMMTVVAINFVAAPLGQSVTSLGRLRQTGLHVSHTRPIHMISYVTDQPDSSEVLPASTGTGTINVIIMALTLSTVTATTC